MSLLSDAALLLLSMEGKLYEAGDLKDEVRCTCASLQQTELTAGPLLAMLQAAAAP